MKRMNADNVMNSQTNEATNDFISSLIILRIIKAYPIHVTIKKKNRHVVRMNSLEIPQSTFLHMIFHESWATNRIQFYVSINWFNVNERIYEYMNKSKSYKWKHVKWSQNTNAQMLDHYTLSICSVKWYQIRRM